jgi:hypothetical protein
LLLGGQTTPSQAIVQIAGYAYRIRSSAVVAEFHNGGGATRVLLRYVQALMTQIVLPAVCNRHHTVEQQLCRWLLLSLDRLSSNRVRMTQELIANMLGVRRTGITEAARELQAARVIEYSAVSSRFTARSWQSTPASVTPWSKTKRTAFSHRPRIR